MKLWLAMIAALAAFLISPAYAAALPAPDGIIEMADPANPPSGYSGPRPMGPRDISMANYPSASFIAGEEGKVRIRVLVGVDGMVTDPQIVASSGSPRLDEAALQLVKGWQYVPAMRDDNPVAARFPVIVDWKLLLVPLKISSAEGKEGRPASSLVLWSNLHGGQSPGGERVVYNAPDSIVVYRYNLTLGMKTSKTILRLLVAQDGAIANATVEKSSGSVANDSDAIGLVKRYLHFKSATLHDGQAAWTWTKMSITFQPVTRARRFSGLLR